VQIFPFQYLFSSFFAFAQRVNRLHKVFAAFADQKGRKYMENVALGQVKGVFT